jgi:hypothetical protein
MESVAGWVLGKAGIVPAWVDCPFSTERAEASSPCGKPLGGIRFLLRITHDHVPAQESVWHTSLGMAHITPEGGTYAILLMDLIETLAREQQIVSKGQILGHAAAHEIGHLLMGSNSHSPHGLMRAGWGTKELQDMAERRLLFSNSEGNRMRVRIAARLHEQPRDVGSSNSVDLSPCETQDCEMVVPAVWKKWIGIYNSKICVSPWSA